MTEGGLGREKYTKSFLVLLDMKVLFPENISFI